MRISVTLAAVAVLIPTVPAIAKDKQDTTLVAADADKRVCRAVQKTGSIMPGRKECHTRIEWRAIDQGNAQNAQNARDRNRVGTMPGRPGE